MVCTTTPCHLLLHPITKKSHDHHEGFWLIFAAQKDPKPNWFSATTKPPSSTCFQGWFEGSSAIQMMPHDLESSTGPLQLLWRGNDGGLGHYFILHKWPKLMQANLEIFQIWAPPTSPNHQAPKPTSLTPWPPINTSLPFSFHPHHSSKHHLEPWEHFPLLEIKRVQTEWVLVSFWVFLCKAI